MIRIGNVEEFLERNVLDKRTVILLGAGATGQNTCEMLVDRGVPVRCFVDEALERRGRKYFGIPVVAEMPRDWKDTCVPILCIGPMAMQPDHVIVESDFMKRMGISDDMLVVLDRPKSIWKTMHRLFKEKDIDWSGNSLNIKDIIFPNYLQMNPYVRRAFLLEAGDLILPYFFDDWSEIDEEPYDGMESLINKMGG